jgi:hypothetical protein
MRVWRPHVVVGQVMNTPEVSRVYMGSFLGRLPLANIEQAELLQRENGFADGYHVVAATGRHAKD